MPVRIVINGFGRMGRLAFRAAWNQPEVEFVHLNETGGDAACAAHLLYFDSLHGRWDRECPAEEGAVIVDGKRIAYSAHQDPAAVPWQEMGVDIVLDSTGRHRTPEALEPFVPLRPGRQEPRAVKKRSKYPVLNKPRPQYIDRWSRNRRRRVANAKKNSALK